MLMMPAALSVVAEIDPSAATNAARKDVVPQSTETNLGAAINLLMTGSCHIPAPQLSYHAAVNWHRGPSAVRPAILTGNTAISAIHAKTAAACLWRAPMSRLTRALAAIVIAAAALSGTGISVRADNEMGCYSDDPDTRIRACSQIIENRNLPSDTRSAAYASRALAFSLKRDYPRAIEDYDRAIELYPNFATALNNRAWAYYKWGKPQMGKADVAKSLELSPESGPTYDTRAHISQSEGDSASALADYTRAMQFGGEQMITMYQCGLQEQGLYKGPRDGRVNAELRTALKLCVENPRCDPLPADEFCRPAAS